MLFIPCSLSFNVRLLVYNFIIVSKDVKMYLHGSSDYICVICDGSLREICFYTT